MSSVLPSLPSALDAPGRAAALAALCMRHGVARLDLFGSAGTEAFDPARSDVDLLVEFAPTAARDFFDGYFAFKTSLEALFERPVDLISVPAEMLPNPYFRRRVLRERRALYRAAA